MKENKYFIAIVPPEPIAGEIYKIKEYVRDQYNSKGSLNSPTHITLHMPFEWENEEKLVNTLQEVRFDPFEIELCDFGCFEPRVIFVSVKESKDLHSLQQKVTSTCRRELNILNAQYRDHPFHPHVTIAFRDLKKPMFEAAWNEFKNRKYSATFECSRLSLMKHDGKFWREFS
jgi:2'-5' RNA ligase